MEQRRLTKKEIVDCIVAKPTFGMFKGDKRDGETPPITVQNFSLEQGRYGAKALRARLSRLSYAELLREAREARDFFKARPGQLAQLAELVRREEAARLLRQRQAELGRRPRLQPGILAAARHYRDQGVSAGEAWDLLNKAPFATDDGNTLEIEGGRLPRLRQRMRVRLRDGRQQKRPIGFDQWRKRYWSAAAKPG
jgi:hypothetical protein